MAFKDLFIKEESAPPAQPVIAQKVAPKAENIMPTQPIVGKAPVERVSYLELLLVLIKCRKVKSRYMARV